jgi:dCTP deaminase
MSILSDRQIKQLCITPTHRYDEETYWRIHEESMQISNLLQVDYPSLQARNDAVRAKDAELRQRSIVPLTPEEIAEFRPMISPFKRESIRYRDPSWLVTDPIELAAGTQADRIREWGEQFETQTGKPAPNWDRRDDMTDFNAWHREQVHVKIISAGLSSFGYDITLSEEIGIFTNVNTTMINPKKFDRSCLVTPKIQVDEDQSRYVVLPPNSYMLGTSVEHFCLPRNVTALFIGKSTYARCGAIVNCTPGEAGWEGVLVIEIANATTLPMMIFIDEGVAQALFFQGSEDCETSYADRGGKYQSQSGLTLAKA